MNNDQPQNRFEREIEKTNKILAEVMLMVASHEAYVSDGRKWRSAIVGIIFTMVFQVSGGLYLSGQITERVNYSTERINRVDIRIDQNENEIRSILREPRGNGGNLKNQ